MMKSRFSSGNNTGEMIIKKHLTRAEGKKQPRILYLARIYFKIGEMKTFSGLVYKKC